MPELAAVAARARAVLPPAGPLRRYAFVSLVDATGTGMFLTASVLYFTRFAGLAAGSVALGLSLAGLAALIGAVPLGSLGDRFGHRRGWSLSYGLAPEDRQGEYLGAFAMGTRIYDSLGPILVTSLILGLGQLGWALRELMGQGARWSSR
jgi:MFS family permease